MELLIMVEVVVVVVVVVVVLVVVVTAVAVAAAAAVPPFCNLVVRPAGSYDPESYAGLSVATGKASYPGQVKGDDERKDSLVL
jgi:hypothetical protein